MEQAALQPRILFVDFDGVLHPEGHGGDVFCRVEHLWEILRACPDVEVVFSTSWKDHYPLDEMVDMATSNGGEDLVHRFVGATPGPLDSREAECLAWLAANRREGIWLALDDRANWFSSDNLYLVNGVTALTAEDVPRIIARLEGLRTAGGF